MRILTNSQGKLMMNQQGKVYEAPVIPVEAEEYKQSSWEEQHKEEEG